MFFLEKSFPDPCRELAPLLKASEVIAGRVGDELCTILHAKLGAAGPASSFTVCAFSGKGRSPRETRKAMQVYKRERSEEMMSNRKLLKEEEGSNHKDVPEPTQEGVEGPATNNFSTDTSPPLVLMKVKKNKKKMMEQKKSRSFEETSSEALKPPKLSALSRSKIYDSSVSKSLENEPALERKQSFSMNLPKHNATFHRVFKEVPEEENLIDSFSCAWQKEVLYLGRLYVSPNFICFFCSMLRKEIKTQIPITSIAILKKANTALLVPNALSIRTVEGEKYLFGSLRNREAAFQVVRSLCHHLQDGSTSSSPLVSPADTSSEQCKKTLSSSQSDLEQKSDEVNCFPDVPDCESQVMNRIKGGNQVADSSPETQRKGESWKDKASPKMAIQARWREMSTVNVLLIIYLLLVVILLLSSGYIGLRIVALEQQLTSMGTRPNVNR